MPKKDIIENLIWARLLAAAVALALVIMMAFAMFSTRNGPYSNHHLEKQYSLGEQFNSFQDNFDRTIHQGTGGIL